VVYDHHSWSTGHRGQRDEVVGIVVVFDKVLRE